MIGVSKENGYIHLVFGHGDIGVGFTENEDKTLSLVLCQLEKEYKAGESITTEDMESAQISFIFSFANKAGYSVLASAIKQIGDKLGFDKLTIGDNIVHNLLQGIGQEALREAQEENERLMAALTKIYTYRSDEPDWNMVMAIAGDIVEPTELVVQD